ncbi:hypothetical protein E1171_00445 [Cytophagales bacterium RKSG123]|nr:hypothetical protein [Xanthovirga aplysinae]
MTNGEFVRKDENGVSLKMQNGNWKPITLDENKDEAGNTFEYYFKDFGFYSVRTQWGEGNGYKLINDSSGKITDLIGRPYFSPNGTFILAVNFDIEAGYSWNGFELFRNDNGQLKKLGIYEPDKWGPYAVKWIDNNRLILKNQTFDFILKNQTLKFRNSDMPYMDFYGELEIKYGG